MCLLCHHVVDLGHPAAKRFGLHVTLHGLDGVVDDAAVFNLKIRSKVFKKIVSKQFLFLVDMKLSNLFL